jgi:hypothetical protein
MPQSIVAGFISHREFCVRASCLPDAPGRPEAVASANARLSPPEPVARVANAGRVFAVQADFNGAIPPTLVTSRPLQAAKASLTKPTVSTKVSALATATLAPNFNMARPSIGYEYRMVLAVRILVYHIVTWNAAYCSRHTAAACYRQSAWVSHEIEGRRVPG